MAAVRVGMSGQVGLVPTMGGLHKGHVALLRAARRECSSVIATLFVNPRQFATAQVANDYPRNEEVDLSLFEAEGVDVAFVPSVEQIYPSAAGSEIRVSHVHGGLEGSSRPGHLDGVATVLTILFNVTRADSAYFGQKDWEQTRLVQQLVRDLALGVDIRVVGTVRDSKGLALGTRNGLLTTQGRRTAQVLWDALTAGASFWGAGERRAATLEHVMRRQLAARQGATVDYAAARDPMTLGPVSCQAEAVALLIAVTIEGVRMIDNVILGYGLVDIDPSQLLGGDEPPGCEKDVANE